MRSAGYVVGQLPSALILSSGRVPPRFWFPFCCACWGFCTLGLAFVTNPQQVSDAIETISRALMCAQVWGIRFTAGVFEASTFSGTHYILGSWYRDYELGKRTAVVGFNPSCLSHTDSSQFVTAAQLGSLFSGVMQGAIVTTLSGRNGLAGWQWLFIIDFLM